MQAPSREFMKTAKGTSLPLLALKGKKYLQVMHRLVWFREEHADWTVKTTIIERQPDHAVVRAEIYNEKGGLMATGHKEEHKAHFPDYMEKAETGAVGRALAMCGYGTQFAPEFDEEERIVDSPAPARMAAPQGTRRPIGPPPQGAKPATRPGAAPEATGENTAAHRGTGQTAPRPASPSEFANFQGGPKGSLA